MKRKEEIKTGLVQVGVTIVLSVFSLAQTSQNIAFRGKPLFLQVRQWKFY